MFEAFTVTRLITLSWRENLIVNYYFMTQKPTAEQGEGGTGFIFVVLKFPK